MKNIGCSNGVIEHCINVSKTSLRIARAFIRKGHRLDIKLIEIGALMHDIGRSKTHGVDHGVVGGDIARKMGLPSSIIPIIENHIGAGITSEEAEKIGLPKRNYFPRTLEEKIIAYADKIVDGKEEVDIQDTVDKFAEELGEDHPSLKRLKDLHQEIISFIGSGT
jgi:uncharacterized protein